MNLTFFNAMTIFRVNILICGKVFQMQDEASMHMQCAAKLSKLPGQREYECQNKSVDMLPMQSYMVVVTKI